MYFLESGLEQKKEIIIIARAFDFHLLWLPFSLTNNFLLMKTIYRYKDKGWKKHEREKLKRQNNNGDKNKRVHLECGLKRVKWIWSLLCQRQSEAVRHFSVIFYFWNTLIFWAHIFSMNNVKSLSKISYWNPNYPYYYSLFWLSVFLGLKCLKLPQ